MIIRLTTIDGDPVFVNYNNVTVIRPNVKGNGAQLWLVDERFIIVKEKYAEVIKKLITTQDRQHILPEIYDDYGAERNN